MFTTLLYFLAILGARANAGQFLQPLRPGPRKNYTGNIKYAVGVNVIIQWVADFSNATITLVQDNHPGDAQGGPSVTLQESYDKTVWNWRVTYAGLDPAWNNVFYLTVSAADGTDSFNSHYFNISGSAESPSAAAAATSQTSPSRATSSSTPASTTPASPPSTTSPSTRPPATVTIAPSSNNDGMPTSIIVGMVVGIVVGILLLVGGAWWAWKIKKRRSNPASTAQPALPHGLPQFDGEPGSFEADGEPKPYEIDGTQTPRMHELEGGRIHELHASTRVTRC